MFGAKKLSRTALQGFVLTMADLTGIWAGFIVFKISGARHQFAVQLPVAVIVALFLFLTWGLLLRAVGLRGLWLRDRSELLWCLIASLIWNPVIFFPLHYFTQGYVSAVSNVLWFAVYQAPLNLLVLLLVRAVICEKGAAVSKCAA